jgi:hypothetical protein
MSFVPQVSLLVLALVHPISLHAREGDDEAPVGIVNPMDEEKLDRVADLEGRIMKKGWPVVLVKPVGGKSDDPVWWVQTEVEEIKKMRFAAKIYLGEPDTPKGSKFKITVVLAASQEDARKYKRGMMLESLPALPRSEIITVTRK